MSLTERAARQLSTQIVKGSNGIRIKFGKTNGRPCLHLIRTTPDFLDSSRTIYSEAEWSEHGWNPANQPRKKKAHEKGHEEDNFQAQEATV